MIKDKQLFFTEHQLKRMAKRGISKAIVNTVFKKGKWRAGKNPCSYEVEYKGVIIVLYENKTQFNVTTCKLNRENTLKAERIKEELGVDFFKAMHKVVKDLDFS